MCHNVYDDFANSSAFSYRWMKLKWLFNGRREVNGPPKTDTNVSRTLNGFLPIDKWVCKIFSMVFPPLNLTIWRISEERTENSVQKIFWILRKSQIKCWVTVKKFPKTFSNALKFHSRSISNHFHPPDYLRSSHNHQKFMLHLFCIWSREFFLFLFRSLCSLGSAKHGEYKSTMWCLDEFSSISYFNWARAILWAVLWLFLHFFSTLLFFLRRLLTVTLVIHWIATRSSKQTCCCGYSWSIFSSCSISDNIFLASTVSIEFRYHFFMFCLVNQERM